MKGKASTMSPIDLSTTYLGLQLANPFIAGASPLSDHLDTVRRLEDGGCAAIVLHSLFEEQITQQETGRIRHMDRLDRQFATVVSYFPEPKAYALGPDEYLEHVRRVKAAVKIPVIGSLNGTTAEAWLKFARLIEQAGADALELNMYEVVTDLDQSAAAVEHGLKQVVRGSQVRAHDSARDQAVAVLHGVRSRGPIARRRRRRRSRAVQSVSPAGHRHPPPGRLAATGAVEQRRTAAAPSLARDSSRPGEMLACRHRRRRHAERRHQGDSGRCRRGADGVGHSAPRPVVLHVDARRATPMDGIPRVRQRRATFAAV